MVRTIGSVFGVSKQTEIIVMTVLALWANMFDMAIFELGTNLDQVWSLGMDAEKFSPSMQHAIKSVVSGIVLVRTFTLHVYIAFLIALIWPALFGTLPALMLPWLLVGFIKNLVTSVASIATGTYTCIAYGTLRPACIRFIGGEFLKLLPSLYMWIVSISFYRDLRKPKEIDKAALRRSEESELNTALRRRKVKSMVDENILRKQLESRRKFIGTSAVVVEDIFKPDSWENAGRKMSRSLDSLLEVMAAETEILDSEEYEPIEDALSLPEKTAKLLGITMSEISRLKQNRQFVHDLPSNPVKAQRKSDYLPGKPKQNDDLSTMKISRLLAGTSLYTPPIKPVRSVKSELRTPKDFMKLQSPSEFMQNIPEIELKPRNDKKDVINDNKEGCDNPEGSQCQKLKCFIETGCQASTLSKRILYACPADVLKILDQPKKSRTILIRPPEDSTPTTKSESKNEVRRKKSLSMRGSNNTYLGLHFLKKDLQKSKEALYGMDKFGVVNNSSFVEDGYSRMYNKEAKNAAGNSQLAERKRSKRKLENAAFRINI